MWGFCFIAFTAEFNWPGSDSIPPATAPNESTEFIAEFSLSGSDSASTAIFIMSGLLAIISNCAIDASIWASVMPDMCGFVLRRASNGIDRSIAACCFSCAGDMDDICLAACSSCSLDTGGAGDDGVAAAAVAVGAFPPAPPIAVAV